MNADEDLLWIEYDGVAAICAERGVMSADQLQALVAAKLPDCWELIEADPDAFAQRIKDFAYGQAMEALNLPEE